MSGLLVTTVRTIDVLAKTVSIMSQSYLARTERAMLQCLARNNSRISASL